MGKIETRSGSRTNKPNGKTEPINTFEKKQKAEGNKRNNDDYDQFSMMDMLKRAALRERSRTRPQQDQRGQRNRRWRRYRGHHCCWKSKWQKQRC